MEIKDAVVLITGGAIRLGRAHGLFLAQRGAHIAFTHLPGEPWEQTKQEIEAHGVRCSAVELDLMDIGGIRRWVTTTHERFGRVDVLVNNASPWLGRPLLEVTEEDWELSLGVNVRAAFFCAQAVAPIMLQQKRGVIVNIEDVSRTVGFLIEQDFMTGHVYFVDGGELYAHQ